MVYQITFCWWPNSVRLRQMIGGSTRNTKITPNDFHEGSDKTNSDQAMDQKSAGSTFLTENSNRRHARKGFFLSRCQISGRHRPRSLRVVCYMATDNWQPATAPHMSTRVRSSTLIDVSAAAPSNAQAIAIIVSSLLNQIWRENLIRNYFRIDFSISRFSRFHRKA